MIIQIVCSNYLIWFKSNITVSLECLVAMILVYLTSKPRKIKIYAYILSKVDISENISVLGKLTLSS